MNAHGFLAHAASVMDDRGERYDSENGERSGAKAAAAFSAITGKSITAAEVYLMLQIVKDVRQWAASGYHADSALDAVSYASLKAEALCAEDGR